jgi:hypothetical protein
VLRHPGKAKPKTLTNRQAKTNLGPEPMWLVFIGGVVGVCGANAIAVAAARRARAASQVGHHRLAPAGVYPEVDRVDTPLLMVAGVGAAIVSVVLTAYSLGHLDSSGAAPNLLSQGAFSGNANGSNAPTGPLKLPRRASVAEVARE